MRVFAVSFKYSDGIPKTPHFTIKKINLLMLFKAVIAVHSENNTKLVFRK
jgi:hypothetical protein